MKQLTFLLVIVLVPSLRAQKAEPPSLRTFSQALQRLVNEVSPAVVQISVQGLGARGDEDAGSGRVRAQRGGGSGVIVDPDGYIVTNAHVVSSSKRIQVLLPDKDAQTKYRSILKPAGKIVDATLVGLDRETDLAVLKVPVTGLPTLKLGDSELLRQGELVLAAGSPYGLQNSVTVGVVSSVARQIRPDDPMIYIQTDASINPGNSGGPLLNADGEVVGINTFILSGSGGNEGVGFAAPSAIVRTVYDQIRKYGRVRRGQVGVIVQTINPELAAALNLPVQVGAVVADVLPGGAAAAAGIQAKDIILSLEGKPIENARQFGVNIYQKGEQIVALEILRGSEKKSVKVSVLERPKDPDRLIALVSSGENLVPRLGILAVDLDEKVTPLLPSVRKLSGAVIVAAIEDGAGAAAGLRAGDVIYEINNRPVGGLRELLSAARDFKPGETAVLYLERFGQLQFVQVDVE
jgi:serine protease Do